MPEILLQFFRSALAHDDNLALEIAKDLDAELVRKGLQYYCLVLGNSYWKNDFCKLNHHMLINAFELADKYGVNLNQNAYVQDAGQREVFHGTASHLLADTKGDLYKLRPIV